MLMADMSESERQTVREMYAPALPADLELIETREGVALVRHPDGCAELVAMHGLPGVLDGLLSPEGLERRAHAVFRLAEDLKRFAGIARAALGQPDPENGWACPSCGRRFGDAQPVCPACGSDGAAHD